MHLLADASESQRANVTVHNSMYRRRSKLREILKIVDRHNTCDLPSHQSSG